MAEAKEQAATQLASRRAGQAGRTSGQADLEAGAGVHQAARHLLLTDALQGGHPHGSSARQALSVRAGPHGREGGGGGGQARQLSAARGCQVSITRAGQRRASHQRICRLLVPGVVIGRCKQGAA